MLNEKQVARMLSKLKRFEDTLDAMIFEKVEDLPVSFYQTADSLYSIPDETLFKPMDPGSHWGGEGVYGWFKTGWQVPQELAGRPLFLRPKVGGYEALLWVDGRPFGTFATKIVVTGHGNHYCDMIVKNPKAGQQISIDLSKSQSIWSFMPGILSADVCRLRKPGGPTTILPMKQWSSVSKTSGQPASFLICGRSISWQRRWMTAAIGKPRSSTR